MFRQIIWVLILTTLIISCKRNIKQEPVIQLERKFQIKCENEKLLIENPLSNLEYSFDTIGSTKSYWQHIRYDQERSFGHRLYPFISISTDTPSLYNQLNIPLVGYREWKEDTRLKTFCYGDTIDNGHLDGFFKRVSEYTGTLGSNTYAEILLAFYGDTILYLKSPLKKIAGIYLSFQKINSQRLFQKDLCNLTTEQIDSLKRNVPFRIRLIRNLNSKGK